MTGKALYLPGPSYHDPNVKLYAGWHSILEYQRQAIEMAGYEVTTPEVPDELIDKTSSFSKIASWSLAASQPPSYDKRYEYIFDLLVGAPSYAHHAFFLNAGESWGRSRTVTYTWNNADWYREEQLVAEYQRFGADFPTQPINRLMNETTLRLSDLVIACSPFVCDTHKRIPDIGPVKVAWWGVDSQLFKPGEKNPTFTILFVGSDPIRKGLAYLIDALRILATNGVPEAALQVWLVGCNVSLGSVGFPVKQFGLVPYSQMPEIMRRCSVICIPTLEDGLACSIQEGLASGCVPITTREAADPFFGLILEAGFEVPYRDSAAIANRLMLLLEDPARLKRMAEAARALAETQTWQKFKEQFAAHVERVR